MSDLFIISYLNEDDEWVELDAVFKKLSQELNGHEELVFTLSNLESNREIVSQDRKIKVEFEGTEIFRGVLYAVEYYRQKLVCRCYVECYETMKAKVVTGTYNGVAADSILSDICTEAGVTAGECPTTTRSVRFRKATCYDAATFLAESLNKDFWADYDSSGNPRFNIGDRVNSSPYPTITPIETPRRKIDRAKKRDKVIIRGVDSEGNEIEGSAGTGTNVAVFTERKASDVDTLNDLAAKKLAELNKESSGVKIMVEIEDAYDLYPGYYVTLDEEELGLSGDYRIYKITKYPTHADVEIDRAEAILQRYLKDMDAYEDLGIYPISSAQMSVPSGTSFPSSPATGQLFYRTDLKQLYRYNGTDWILSIEQPFDNGTAFPSSPVDGQLFYRTDKNKVYRYDATNGTWHLVDLRASDISSHSGADVSSHTGTDVSSHTGTGVSSHTGTGVSSHSGTDVSPHSGTAVDSHSGTDVSSHTGTGVSSHTGTGVSSHTGTGVSSHTGTDVSSHTGTAIASGYMSRTDITPSPSSGSDVSVGTGPSWTNIYSGTCADAGSNAINLCMIRIDLDRGSSPSGYGLIQIRFRVGTITRFTYWVWMGDAAPDDYKLWVIEDVLSNDTVYIDARKEGVGSQTIRVTGFAVLQYLKHTHSVTQPADHTVTQPSDHTVTDPADHSVTDPADHSVTDPADHSVTQPADHTVTQPSNHTVTQPADHSVTDPADHTVTQPSDHTVTDPADHTVTQPSDHTLAT